MDFQQDLEEQEAKLRDISKLLYSYHKILIDAGFSEKQAFQLVADYHAILINGGKK